jgi:ADP-ribose pyrophosphatase
MPLARALDMVRGGEITDAKTVAGLFWAERVLCGQWSKPVSEA